jgi:hypothetical protein
LGLSGVIVYSIRPLQSLPTDAVDALEKRSRGG